MKTTVSVLVGLVILALPASGQERPVCVGKGAAAPDWFERPPPAPPGTYQTEARSGGCRDAEAAQKVAARTAAWRLAHLMSAPVLVEELLTVRRRIGARTYRREEEEVELVQRALAGKILTSGWAVHRQETRWTAEGLAEHFVIVRADSAGIRDLAAEELRTYLSGSPGGGANVIDLEDVPDTALRWVEEPRRNQTSEETVTAHTSGGRTERTRGKSRRLSQPPTEQGALVPTLVLAGTVRLLDSAGINRLGLERAAASLDLLSSGAGAALVVAGAYSRGRARTFTLVEVPTTVELRESTTMAGFLLFAFKGWPAFYGGYRYRRSETLRPDVGRVITRTEPRFVAGIGVPLFTERTGQKVTNAYVEFGLSKAAPAFREVRAGVKGEIVAVPGLALRGFLLGEAGVTALGLATSLAPEFLGRRDPPETQILARKLGLEAGVELTVAGAVSVVVTSRYAAYRLLIGSGADLAEYARVSEDVYELDFVAGLRLAL